MQCILETVMAYYRMYRHHLFDTYKGVFLMENKKLLEEIRSYWNNRADGYSRVNQEELHSEQKEKWKEVLLEQPRFQVTFLVTI